MEISQLLVEANITVRLNYVFSLLRLMKDADSHDQRALAGGIAMWIGAVDASLDSMNPQVAGTSYKVRRSEEAGGRTVFGLRLSRNEIAHGDAMAMVSGVEVPFEFPLRFHLRFVQTDILARQHLERSGKSLREHHLKVYGEHVANQDPVVVFQRAYDWLREIAAA